MHHPGELSVQHRAGVYADAHGSATVGSGVPAVAQQFLLEQRMIVISAEHHDSMWTTVLVGQPGFIETLDETTFNIKADLPAEDPLFGAFDAQFAWVESADTFFVGTGAPGLGADASHRGGNPGFVSGEPERLSWPDYLGNSMYMTFGNLELDPRAGLLFIDFENGHSLHIERNVVMNLRSLTVAIPLLMLVYGVARWFDGRDGEYGPGVAWNIGHAAFLVAFVGFGALTVHFRRSSSHPHVGAIIANVASLVGVGLFIWVITTHPGPGRTRFAPRSGHGRRPLDLIVGFVASLAIHARQIGMKWWVAPPILALAALMVVGADLDLLPLTAVLLAAALVPVGMAQPLLGFARKR